MADWTEEEEQYLLDNYKECNVNEIFNNVNHTRQAIYRKAVRLDLTGNYKEWTRAEQKFLSLNCRKFTVKELADKLSRTIISIRSQLRELKLFKYKIRNSKNKCVDCGRTPGDRRWPGWWIPDDQHFRSNLCKQCAKEYFHDS